MEHIQSGNIKPINLVNTQKYQADILMMEDGFTGRLDVMFSNIFFKESIQLLINSLYLFKIGFFDCAFYSLRQSIEIATTSIFFVDDDKENRDTQMKRWKNNEWFPMNNKMNKQLIQRKRDYADMKKHMGTFYNNLDSICSELNKYVHKQGYDKFYVERNNPLKQEKYNEKKLIEDYEKFLRHSIGAVAVFRLGVDPLPVLLSDDDIYSRTPLFLTDCYGTDFINTYIGEEHIKNYKKTQIYKAHYESLIKNEKRNIGILELTKENYIDRGKKEHITAQIHLLNFHERICFGFVSLSNKISKMHCLDGFETYYTDLKSNNDSYSFNTKDYLLPSINKPRHNISFKKSFLSHFQINKENFCLEHNSTFTNDEISQLQVFCNIIDERMKADS